jgi:serine/threonine-protein phosphatase 2B catalytic subunit
MDPLPDPCNDRRVPSVLPLPAYALSHQLLFPNENGGNLGAPDLEVLRDHLLREGRLRMEDIFRLCRAVKDVITTEPNVIKVKDPLIIVGDLHGQYYDLLKMLDMGGPPDDYQYVMLGDYVDRGSFGCEVVFLVFALKLIYPKRIWLLRGNHESRQMTEYFNFRSEAESKYDTSVWEEIMLTFDHLPVAAIVNGKFLSVHGGIGPDMKSIDAIQKVNREGEPPRQGIICDLLWADPAVDKKVDKQDEFTPNKTRGCSYHYSFAGVCNFLQRTGLLAVIRAHEVQQEGYKMHQDNKKTGFPCVITVFSAPNYCDAYNNKAAVLKFKDNTLNILQYHCTPHPYHLPSNMSLMAWSLPFVSEKVVEILSTLLLTQPDDDNIDPIAEASDLPPKMKDTYRKSLSASQNSAVALAAKLQEMERQKNTEGPAPATQTREQKAIAIRNKIKTVGRMQVMFKHMREKHELQISVKDRSLADKLNASEVKSVLADVAADRRTSFKKLKRLDSQNERRPDAEGDAPEDDEDEDDEILSPHMGKLSVSFGDAA